MAKLMPRWLDHVKTRSFVFDGDNVSSPGLLHDAYMYARCCMLPSGPVLTK